MKRARYHEPSTGTFVDVLVAQPDACGVWDISTLPPRPREPSFRAGDRVPGGEFRDFPPRPWVRPSGADFWRAQRADGNPFLSYPGGC